MTDTLRPHRDLALRHGRVGIAQSPIPYLEICVGQVASGTTSGLYGSMICFILLGAKDVAIPDNLLRYPSFKHLVSAPDIPLSGQIHHADDGNRYVAISLIRDPVLLAEVASTMPVTHEAEMPRSGIAINPRTALRDTEKTFRR